MKTTAYILLFGLISGLFACNSQSNKNSKSFDKTLMKDSISETNIQLASIDTTTESIQDNNCVRGQAEPIIKKEKYPNTTFVLQPDSLTGIETVNFENGDKLIIHNWGCEYYVLTFRFETTQFQHDTTNYEYWFRSAHSLITKMLSGIEAPIDIKKGLVFLDSYIARDSRNNYKNLKLGEEINFGGEDIRDFVTVDRIEKIADNKYSIEVSFATGPL